MKSLEIVKNEIPNEPNCVGWGFSISNQKFARLFSLKTFRASVQLPGAFTVEQHVTANDNKQEHTFGK